VTVVRESTVASDGSRELTATTAASVIAVDTTATAATAVRDSRDLRFKLTASQLL